VIHESLYLFETAGSQRNHDEYDDHNTHEDDQLEEEGQGCRKKRATAKLEVNVAPARATAKCPAHQAENDEGWQDRGSRVEWWEGHGREQVPRKHKLTGNKRQGVEDYEQPRACGTEWL
jgi:hypothetical protein